MSLDTKYEELEKYILEKSLTEKEVLLFLANFLFHNIHVYENIDKSFGLYTESPLTDYIDYLSVQNMAEYHEESNALDVANVAHRLLYIYNRIKITEDSKYAK